MADEQEIQVSIVAKIQGLLDGLAHGASSVKEHTEGMGEHLGGLGEIAEGLGGKFAGLTELGATLGPAILAVGALAVAFKAAETAVDFVKDAVHETLELAEQFKDLAYQTGMSADELMQWKIAANLEGGNISVLESAVRGASRAIGSNTQFLIDNGVAASQAQLKAMPFQEYLQRVMEKADELAPGLQRNEFLTKALGRAGVEAAPQLKEMLERMGEAKNLAQEYGVAVGEDDIKAMEDFKGNMGQFTTAWEALKTSVGEAVIPVLNQFLSLIVDNLPTAVDYAKSAVLGTVTAWFAFSGAVFHAIDVSEALVKTLAVGVVNGAVAAAQALSGNLTGALNTSAQAMAQVKELWQGVSDGAAAYEAYATGVIDRVTQKLAGGSKAYEGPKGTGTVRDRTQDDQLSQYQIQAFKQELEQKKAAEDNWFTWSTAKELAFWQEKLAQTKQGSRAYVEVLSEINKLKKKAAEEEQANAKASVDREIAAAREGSQEKVNLAMREAERIKGVYGEESKEYQAAMQREEAAAKAHADKMRELDSLIAQNHRDAELASLQIGLDTLRDEASAGLITKQQLLQQEQEFEKRMFQIKLREAKDAAAAEPDPIKHQQLLNKIEQLEREHGAKMAQISRQAVQQQRATYDTWFNGITSGFQNAVQGLIQGTMTWGQAFKSVLADMGNFLIQQSEQMVMKWVADRLYEMIFGKTTREADVVGASSVYAVNAMASVAAIPFVGWAMAPGVGAAAFAEGMSFLPSAAGGWDRVPNDTLAQIHKDEMVMSAPLAQGLRDLIAGGGKGGGQVVHEHHYTIHAMDAKSFHDFLRTNKGALMKVTGEAVRDRRTR